MIGIQMVVEHNVELMLFPRYISHINWSTVLMSFLLFASIDYLIYHRPLLHHLRSAKHSRTDGCIYNLGRDGEGPPYYSCCAIIQFLGLPLPVVNPQ